MTLERIITEGTKAHLNLDRGMVSDWMARSKLKPSNMIHCADGFTMSVTAGDGCYCSPRPGWFDGTPETFEGPYSAVEVGYPSSRPEPWGDWEQCCENPDAPTSTVYGYVPVTLVRALVAAHGGES